MINFKDWAKVKEDKKGAEMQHPDGHKIYLLYKGLPAIQAEALKRLPLYEGGEVKGVHKSSMEVERPQGIKGGEKRMAGRSEAGEAVSDTVPKRLNPDREEQQHNDKQYQKAKDEHHKVLGEMVSMPNPKLKGLAQGGMAHYDDGTPDAPVSSDDADTDQKPPVTVNVNQAPTPAAANVATQAATPINPQVAPAAPASNATALYPNQTQNAPNALKLGTQGANEQQAIDAEKAKQAAIIEQARVDANTRQTQIEQQQYQDMSQHTDDYRDYLQNNPIDPNAYIKNLSAPEKVATGFGLLAGGFTQGFTHGAVGNAASDWLNNQMNRDIDAQKTNSQNQHTLWGAYQSLYGDSNIADKLARASMDDVYTHQFNLLNAKMGTPQAQATRDALVSKLQSDRQQQLIDAAKYRAANFGPIPQTGNAQPQGGQAPQSQIGVSPQQYQQIQDNDQKIMNGQQGEAQPEDTNKYSILKPAATDFVNNMNINQPLMSESDKQMAMDQYNKAKQADDSIKSIVSLYPRLGKEATLSGDLANRINPHAAAGVGAGIGIAAGEGAGIAAAPYTGGFSLPAGHAAAALLGSVGGAAGEAAGAGVKQGLHIIAGQQGIAYDTDKATLVGYIKAAVPGIGDQLADKIADDFTPKYFDSEANKKKKLENLIEKIHDLTPTGALDRKKLTNK